MEDLLGSGLLRFPIEVLSKDLPSALATIPSPFQLSLPPQIVAQRFLSSMILSDAQCKTIDLHSGWIPTFIYRVDRYIIIDWFTFRHTFSNLLFNVARKDQIKNIKGDKFEKDIDNWLHSRIPHLEHLFRPNQKLKAEKQLYGEIDLSFIVRNVGFIIDCKAYNTSIAFHRGDAKAVKTRLDYTERWLSQVIRTAKKLAEQPQGDNYQMPPEIEYLVPLVVSTTVEPLFDLDEKHLVTEDIPRVCTPNELIEILTEIPIDALINNSFTFTVKEE